MFQKKFLLGRDIYLIIYNLLNDADRSSECQPIWVNSQF